MCVQLYNVSGPLGWVGTGQVGRGCGSTSLSLDVRYLNSLRKVGCEGARAGGGCVQEGAAASRAKTEICLQIRTWAQGVCVSLGLQVLVEGSFLEDGRAGQLGA